MSLLDPSLRPSRARVVLALTGVCLTLGGCAVAPGAPDSSGAESSTDTAKVAAAVAAGVAAGNAASARPGASPASVAQAAGTAAAAAAGPRPFAEVIKDAKETPGLFRTWQKDEKVWIELAPNQFGVPYHFTSNLSRGVGEQGVYGGMTLGERSSSGSASATPCSSSPRTTRSPAGPMRRSRRASRKVLPTACSARRPS